jgi:hypothetical protein
MESIISCTLHLFKDQPEDGPTIGPKHVAGIITQYNLKKCKVVYDCIMYIFLYYIMARHLNINAVVVVFVVIIIV